jgi:serine/threonine-protein kinase
MDRLGRYQLVERIGSGGMAEVFKAELRGTGSFAKTVCVKRIRPESARDPELVAMFMDEATLAARFDHPNLVPILDFGEVDGEYFLAMELVDGADLDRVLEDGPLDPALATHVALAVARALAYLHARGVVHRDVSPSNVLLSKEGAVKLGDFGVVKTEGRRAHTETGTIKGKLRYMSPEQATGGAVGPKSDAYALGAVYWEMLVGTPYLGRGDGMDMLRRAAAPEFRPPSAVRPDLGPVVDRLAARALAPDPADRADATEIVAALEEASRALPAGPAEVARRVEAARARPSQARTIVQRRTPRRDARRRIVWIGLAVLVLAGVGVAALVVPSEAPAPRAPRIAGAPPPSTTAPPASTAPARSAEPLTPTPPPRTAVAHARTVRPVSARPVSTTAPVPSPSTRAAIEARIRRVDARARTAFGPSGPSAEFRRLSAHVLSDFVNARYEDADRGLDQLEAMLPE